MRRGSAVIVDARDPAAARIGAPRGDWGPGAATMARVQVAVQIGLRDVVDRGRRGCHPPASTPAGPDRDGGSVAERAHPPALVPLRPARRRGDRAGPREAARAGTGGEVVAPDPGWPAVFDQVRERISNALGSVALEIEHVGSTSVPGLWLSP